MQHLESLVPGTVVKRDYGFFHHFGVTSGVNLLGRCSIIANSWKTGVAEQSIEEFADGGQIEVVGYYGVLPPLVVVERARSRIGERYVPGFFDCDHFVRWAHGVKVESPQVRVAVVSLLVSVALGLALRKA